MTHCRAPQQQQPQQQAGFVGLLGAQDASPPDACGYAPYQQQAHEAYPGTSRLPQLLSTYSSVVPRSTGAQQGATAKVLLFVFSRSFYLFVS